MKIYFLWGNSPAPCW